MKFKWNAQKAIILTILLLIGCDISILFAGQVAVDNSALQLQQLQQIQQLQKQTMNSPARSLPQNQVSLSAPPPAMNSSAGYPPQNQMPASDPQRYSQNQMGSKDHASSNNYAQYPATPLEPQQQQSQQPQAAAASEQLALTDPPYQQIPAAPYPQTTTSVPPPAAFVVPSAPNTVVVANAPSNPEVVMPANTPAALPPAPGAEQFTTPPPSPAVLPPPAFAQPDQVNAPPPRAEPGAIPQSEIRNQAFNAVLQNQLPMTPEQIQRLRQLFNQAQFAATSSPTTPPRPTATSQLVNLAPGSTPPVIRLAQGFVSSLVFIDSTGAPWPIEAYDIGNPGAFNIQWNKSDNTLMIQSTTLYTYGNLAVRLQGLNTPVMLTLIPGQKAVDYRVDLRIQALGPNAVAPAVIGLPATPNPELLGVLDGVPPAGSTAVEVSGCGGVEVWMRKEQMFVRTRYTIISPGWVATMSSADGMKAYQMVKSPLLLIAQNGKIVPLKVDGL